MSEDQHISKKAAESLQDILDDERKRREEAEKNLKALVEEFTSCNDFDDVRKKFREKVAEIAPVALTNIIQLMNNAESESVRAGLNKWVLEWAMSEKIEGKDSDLQKFLKELQPKEPTNSE